MTGCSSPSASSVWDWSSHPQCASTSASAAARLAPARLADIRGCLSRQACTQGTAAEFGVTRRKSVGVSPQRLGACYGFEQGLRRGPRHLVVDAAYAPTACEDELPWARERRGPVAPLRLPGRSLPTLRRCQTRQPQARSKRGASELAGQLLVRRSGRPIRVLQSDVRKAGRLWLSAPPRGHRELEAARIAPKQIGSAS